MRPLVRPAETAADSGSCAAVMRAGLPDCGLYWTSIVQKVIRKGRVREVGTGDDKEVDRRRGATGEETGEEDAAEVGWRREGRDGERGGDSERREMQGMIYAAIFALISS